MLAIHKQILWLKYNNTYQKIYCAMVEQRNQIGELPSNEVNQLVVYLTGDTGLNAHVGHVDNSIRY